MPKFRQILKVNSKNSRKFKDKFKKSVEKLCGGQTLKALSLAKWNLPHLKPPHFCFVLRTRNPLGAERGLGVGKQNLEFSALQEYEMA